MGYRVDRSTVVLELADMDGAEVAVSIGVPLSALRRWDEAPDLDAEWAVFLDAAAPRWNLEDEEGPIAVDAAALDRLPVYVSRAMMVGWRRAAVNPPAPLPQPSGSGEQ